MPAWSSLRVWGSLIILLATSAGAQELSTSLGQPTVVDPATGQIAAHFPGGDGSTSYYVTVDVGKGDLIARVAVAGTPDTLKRVDLELLNPNARVADSFYVATETQSQREASKTFPMDTSGRQIIRLIVDGGEEGTFCVRLSGPALPQAKPPPCPAPRAAGPLPPVTADSDRRAADSPAAITPVSVAAANLRPNGTKCQERLRIGSIILFDANRADILSDADQALGQLALILAQKGRPALIEGHADNSESQSQTLSERRATAVRRAIVQRSSFELTLDIRGYGHGRPAASHPPNNGSGDPDGRRKNRRVEVVIGLCG